MSTASSTYLIPEEIFADVDGMLVSDRKGLEQVWSMIDESVLHSQDNGKARVKSALFAAVSRTSDRAPLRLSQPMARMYSMRMKVVSIAAALIVGLSLVLSPSSTQFQTETGSLTPTLVSLSDGSSVRLAAGSRLSVPDAFGKENRTVILHGQAFFNAEEGSVPFVVQTFDSKTEVLGTSFSVTAWPSSMDASTEVVVKTGRVSVASLDEVVLLTPGELVRVGTELNKTTIDITSALSWVDGGFYFNNELVENVISEIERRYDVSIHAPTSIKLRRFNYSTPTSPKNAGEVLGDLAATIGVRYRATANGYELYLQ